MVRAYDINCEKGWKATVVITYNSPGTGEARITIEKITETEGGFPIVTPEKMVILPLQHQLFTKIEEIRQWDNDYVQSSILPLFPDQGCTGFTLNYDHDGIHSRYAAVLDGQVIGIAQFMDEFSENTSMVQYISAQQSTYDDIVESDRFSYHHDILWNIAAKLAPNPIQVEWRVVK